MYSQWACSARGAYDVISVFGFLKSQHPWSYDKTNKELPHLSAVSVKICLPSTRTVYSDMCPTNGPHDWKNSTVDVLEEEAECNLSVCT